MKFGERQAYDRDGSTLYNDGITTDHLKQYTEEAQLQGHSWCQKLTRVAGVYFLQQPAEKTDDLLEFRAPNYVPADNNAFFSGARNRITSKAGYAQGTYDLSSWAQGLKFTAGLRYTWDDHYADVTNDPACATAACAT